MTETNKALTFPDKKRSRLHQLSFSFTSAALKKAIKVWDTKVKQELVQKKSHWSLEREKREVEFNIVRTGKKKGKENTNGRDSGPQVQF